MIDCSQLSERMPEVAAGDASWSQAETSHLQTCPACAEEWPLVLAGAGLYSTVSVDPARITRAVLARLRDSAQVVPLHRLPWRHFALGLAAAASVALAVWIPGRHPAVLAAVTLPTSMGPVLPSLSSLTDEQLDRVMSLNAASGSAGVPGSVPHLGDLTESDLEQLSRLSESP